MSKKSDKLSVKVTVKIAFELRLKLYIVYFPPLLGLSRGNPFLGLPVYVPSVDFVPIFAVLEMALSLISRSA